MNKRNGPKSGFTLLEMLIVVAIIGILTLAGFPSILNMLETRRLDSAARDIQTSLQIAKFQAVMTKLDHRVRFFQQGTNWCFCVEAEETAGNWIRIRGYKVDREIPNKLTTTLNLPSTHTVTFNSMGFVGDFASGSNSILLNSVKLHGSGQADLRTITFYQGGTIQYTKSISET